MNVRNKSMGVIFLCCTCAIFSVPAQKKQPLKALVCIEGPAGFRAVLDPNDYEARSGLYTVKDANVYYNYSGAKLICEGHKPDELQCIGYWIASGEKEIAEVRTFVTNGKIVAQFKTAKIYKEVSVSVNCTFS